ncbi:aminopeptidase N [Nocardioides sp. GY 10127]|uniref:aminopeptidase N n=1 Tax=Nocardioides sp. GY 10127 TaxID=2569762 RepID=UPI0010A77BED|nr:aminopeptidase N [Nocardioides sp. GY 10127]TIC84369.1 aminopeptidase N [Nocardioides sp. GY 10127]
MSLTLAEARSRAAVLSNISYDLDLDLTDPAQGTYGCTARVGVTTAEPETFLELKDGEGLTVTLDGEPVDHSYDGRRVRLRGLPTGVPLVLEVVARVPYVTDGDGMHLMTDAADGETYASAYLSLDVAQRVFPCFDQVDLKGPLTLAVTADPRWTVIANGRVVSDAEERAAGRWRFATTPPVCPSLFVVCAGPWHSVTWEHAGLPFGWHARASLAADLDRDAPELIETTNGCFDHYATLFEEPYAFDSYDQLFGPGHNWGAMETPGCVTYRDEYLPRGRTSEVARVGRATTIAHEMAHMWFGNLVTMRWWEDTWLNESFADYLGYRVAADGAGFPDTLVGHEGRRKPGAYTADERRSTHPVAPLPEEVPDVDSAFANFDAISYSKGNSLLRQLVTWLGDPDFLAGVNAHLSAHRFGNATLADFVASLDAHSERDVAAWAQAWLRTTGFDILAVTRESIDGQDDVPVLRRQGTRPHRVAVVALDGPREVARALVDVADDPVPLPDWAGLAVVPNAGGESFVRLALDPASSAAVAEHLSSFEDPLLRTVLWAHAFDRVHTRDLDVAGYVELVRQHLPRESDATLVGAVVGRTLGPVLALRTPAEHAPTVVATVAGACAVGLLSSAAPTEGVALALTQGLAATSSDAGMLEGWLAAGHTEAGVALDPTLRWRVVARLAELGQLDAEGIEAERVADPTSSGDLGAARALAARPTAAAKAEAWATMTEPGVGNRLFEACATGLWSAEEPSLVREYVDAYLEQAPGIAGSRGQGFSLVVGRAFPTVALTAGQKERLAALLASGSVPTVLARLWNDTLDDLA